MKKEKTVSSNSDLESVIISQKGEVKFPKKLRERLLLDEGVEAAVYAEGSNVVIKPLYRCTEKSFCRALDQTMA